MKIFKWNVSLLFMFILLMSSCSKDENIEPDMSQEKATLSFGSLLNDLASHRAENKQSLQEIPSCSDGVPAYVEVALSQDGSWVVGDDTNTVRVNLSPNPADYDGDGTNNYFTVYSPQLELNPGNYSLEYFTVYDAQGTEIWRAPRSSGGFGSMVDSPLPMEISLGAGTKKYVNVDVLCYDNRMVNEYGYLFFDIQANELMKFCVFGNYCDENGRHFPAHFSMDVWSYSGDAANPKGQVIETGIINTVGVNNDGDAYADPICVVVPDKSGLDEYYFEITLLTSTEYDAEESIIRSGVITDEDVRALYDGDSNTNYFHFMEGNCGASDSPNLFTDVNTNIKLPAGYKIEKLANGLHLPTSVTWDDEGNMFVSEAGGGLFPEQLARMRIVEIKRNGTKVLVADLSNKADIKPSLVGLVWHNGWFYFTHRADDLTGAVSRVNKSGQVELIFKGILDSQAEHQINDIKVGPDGMMYIAVGPAGNSGVMDLSVAPWVKKSPGVHATPCQDIVLVGKNFQTPNFLTPEEGDVVQTGAFVPFGEQTSPGQVIKGVSLCGGSILKFDPNNALSTITTHAWGFRNLIGITWDSKGNMYAGENGYDVRGSRPVKDYMDASLRIYEGRWYGVPDYSAGREPLTDAKFEVPDTLQAPIFINGVPIGKDLGFIIDHQASGLMLPDPSMVLGVHEFNSSPTLLDAAPTSWGAWADHLFIAEWGDLAPPTNPLRGGTPSGFRVVRVDPASGQLEIFASNPVIGPASAQGLEGEAIERPFDVKFGPDGAMYIVDYGVVNIDYSKAPPYAYKVNSGVIWKVTKTSE